MDKTETPQRPHQDDTDVTRRAAIQQGAKLAYVVPLVMAGITLQQTKLTAASVACW